jgi:hypothetical protein
MRVRPQNIVEETEPSSDQEEQDANAVEAHLEEGTYHDLETDDATVHAEFERAAATQEEEEDEEHARQFAAQARSLRAAAYAPTPAPVRASIPPSVRGSIRGAVQGSVASRGTAARRHFSPAQTSDEGFPTPGTKARAEVERREAEAKKGPFQPLPGTRAARAAKREAARN